MATVRWLPWTIDAFARARDEARPILLSIVTPWSEACAEMDRTTYADAGIAAAIADDFVPVRVDADRRPDIADRYGLDVWPTTAFLTADGAMITGGLFMPADRMLAALAQVRDAFISRRDELLDSREHWRAAEPAPPHPVSSAPVSDAELEALVFESFDEAHGGFGGAPKFPLTAPLALALELFEGSRDARLAQIVQTSLDGMGWGPLYDESDGGFYRCAGEPDWSAPQPEKLLETNAALLRLYLDAADILRVTRYRDRAAGTLRFVQTWLADPVDGGWTVSRSATPGPGGASAGPQGHGDVFYAGWNAAMAGAALRASLSFDDKGLGEFALKSLERVLIGCYRPGAGVAHCYEPPHGASVRGLLDDQMAMADAQLDAYEATGNIVYEMMAQELAHYAVRTMWDELGGGFFDRSEVDVDELIGRMRDRVKPFVGNCEAGRVLKRLAAATGDQSFAALADTALAAVAPQAAAQGPLAAYYLRARRVPPGQSDKLAGK